MNKSIRIIGMAAMVLLLAASCKKENQNGSRKVTVKAGIESPAKTYVDGENFARWNEEDEIMINGSKLTLTEMLNGGKEAKFEGEWLENEPLPDGEISLHCITPAVDQKKLGNGDWGSWAQVLKEQTYIKENGRRFMDNLPMGCHTTTINNIEFHNLTSVFRIRVYASTSKNISKVEMIKNTGTPLGHDGDGHYDDYPIAGTIWYPHAGNDLQNLELVDDEQKSYTITLNCGTNGVAVSTSESTPTDFYFVAWPVQMGRGVIFKFYDMENNLVASIEKPINIEDTVEPNTIYTFCENNTGQDAAQPYKLNWLN